MMYYKDKSTARSVVFDMETGDPDDVFALCFITSHPDLDLVGVTITPGSNEQVGIVRHILHLTDHSHVPVGSRTPGYHKAAVSQWHYNWLGDIPPEEPNAEACDVIFDVKPTLVVTGAAPTNLARTLQKYPKFGIPFWVAQGGFAGDNVVPEQYRLEKFAGKISCPTYNFGGDPKGALYLLESENIFRKYLISKNVCHGVKYDKEFHRKVEPYRNHSPGLKLIYEGMSKYLKKKSGKAFHDPLAACFAVDNSICEMASVIMFREKNEWGAKPAWISDTFISISVDMDKFVKTLTRT